MRLQTCASLPAAHTVRLAVRPAPSLRAEDAALWRKGTPKSVTHDYEPFLCGMGTYVSVQGAAVLIWGAILVQGTCIGRGVYQYSFAVPVQGELY